MDQKKKGDTDMASDQFFKNNYDDIINLPPHISSRHPHMSMIERAAQFSPFAALTDTAT